jgi:ADP-ribose pyrophosphatase
MSYELIEKQVLYKGRKLNLELHYLQDEQGRRTQREIVVHRGAVVVLPFLDDGDTILLIRNRRYALGQVLTELPAGTLEAGESPMNCAGRELVEETGYLAARLQSLASFFPSPGILTEKMYAFVAYNLEKAHSALDDGEEIEVVPTAFDDALEMIRTGLIADGKTIACLLLYERFHRRDAHADAPAADH